MSNECRELLALLPWDLLSSAFLSGSKNGPNFVLNLWGLRYFTSHLHIHTHPRISICVGAFVDNTSTSWLPKSQPPQLKRLTNSFGASQTNSCFASRPSILVFDIWQNQGYTLAHTNRGATWGLACLWSVGGHQTTWSKHTWGRGRTCQQQFQMCSFR